METIIMNGVTLTLTEETAKQIRAELEEVQMEREAELATEVNERRFMWMIFHWYGRRWAMYGHVEDWDMFSDMYKDDVGVRPRGWTADRMFDFLYRHDCRVQHGPWTEWR